jgi:hypothetical protein
MFMFTQWKTGFMNICVFHWGALTSVKDWKWAQKWADAVSFASQRYFNEYTVFTVSYSLQHSGWYRIHRVYLYILFDPHKKKMLHV